MMDDLLYLCYISLGFFKKKNVWKQNDIDALQAAGECMHACGLWCFLLLLLEESRELSYQQTGQKHTVHDSSGNANIVIHSINF